MSEATALTRAAAAGAARVRLLAAVFVTSGAVTGLVVVDDAPLLLVDLPTLVREHPGAPPSPPQETP